MLEPTQIAPDFTLPRDDGSPVTLSALRPAPVAIFFYPQDDTETCTLEACAFSTALPDFSAIGVHLMGLSRDGLASHQKFAAKYGLQMPLLSDEAGSVCEAFGVWQQKKKFGRTYMGIVRSTFLIDAMGRVAQVWSPVRVKGHVEAVLAAAKALPPLV